MKTRFWPINPSDPPQYEHCNLCNKHTLDLVLDNITIKMICQACKAKIINDLIHTIQEEE